MRTVAKLRPMTARWLADEQEFDEQDQPPVPVRRGPLNWFRVVAPFLCWAAAVAALLFAFIRVFGLEATWPGQVIIVFTPYVALLSLLGVVFAAVLRRWRASVVALVATFALVSVVVPRAIGSADNPRGPALRVMSSNLYLGTADAQDIVNLVKAHQIDVLALEEYTGRARFMLTAAGIDAMLPYSKRDPRPDARGSAIYSRYPLTDTGVIELPEYFGQVYATVNVPGALPVQVTVVHPCAPVSPREEAGCWAGGLAKAPHATPKGSLRLLLGDFNASLDHAILRKLIATGYEDVADKLGDGLQPTWPYYGTGRAVVPKLTLDHVLVDARIGVSDYGTNRVDHTDHKSIHATVTLPRG